MSSPQPLVDKERSLKNKRGPAAADLSNQISFLVLIDSRMVDGSFGEEAYRILWVVKFLAPASKHGGGKDLGSKGL